KLAKQQMAAIEKMDASDVEYNVSLQRLYEGGRIQFNKEANRVEIIVSNDLPEVGSGYEASLAHELEHGRQFEDRELDFSGEGNLLQAGPSHDWTDEMKGVDVEEWVSEKTDRFNPVSREQKKAHRDSYNEL